jgi:tetratricopeptide (TPR) repeat protein
MGQFQKAFETCQKGSELARKVGALYNLSWLYLELAQSYLEMGDVKKAISILEEITAFNKRTKYTVHLPSVMASLGWGYRIQGEWERSLGCLKEGLRLANEVGEYQFSSFANLELGELYMEMEDYVQAEKYIKEAVKIDEIAGDIDLNLISDFPSLSKLYLKKGETEKAKELIERIFEFGVKTNSRLIISNVEKLRGTLFKLQKNWKESVQHFENSLEIYKSMEAEKWYVIEFADLLYEYGLMYLERNEEADKEKTFSLLDQALAIYQKIDAKRRIEQMISKKKLLTA